MPRHLERVFLLFKFIYMQVETFGIDWEGPVPVDSDADDRVTVEELEDLLSDTQKEELKDLLNPISNNYFSQQEMLGQYAIAKSYIEQHSAE